MLKMGGGKLNSVKNNIYDVVHPAMFLNKIRKIEQCEYGVAAMFKLLMRFCKYQFKKHLLGYKPKKNDNYNYDFLQNDYDQIKRKY
jgi:hypothetical protein